MVNVWRPSPDHNRYGDDPAFLEERFGVEPVAELLRGDVLGVARFVILPSFEGEAIFTFVYRTRFVTINSAIAERSLWGSLHTGKWSEPIRNSYSVPVEDLPNPLQEWSSLKETARAAPSVRVAIIDGRSYITLDGVMYRHTVCDFEETIDAQWSNPAPEATNHVLQMTLVTAYDSVISKIRMSE